MAFCHDTVTFDMRSLAAKDYAPEFSTFGLIACAVKLPIFPRILWLFQMPTGSTAPMLLAGILLKMGGMF